MNGVFVRDQHIVARSSWRKSRVSHGAPRLGLRNAIFQIWRDRTTGETVILQNSVSTLGEMRFIGVPGSSDLPLPVGIVVLCLREVQHLITTLGKCRVQWKAIFYTIFVQS